MPQEPDRSGPDDIGCLHHDHVTEDLISDHDLWKHQDIGVASARVAEPMDLKGLTRVGQWPIAQQSLIGVGQDHPLCVGELLNLSPELLGLLDLPTHRG